MRILIADDEHLARITLRSNLEEISSENEIIEVSNGLQLINEAPKFRPHIAIIDINMPKFSGLEAIASLKEKLPLTQWIILTGYAQFDFAKEALQMGVSDYLLKPIRPIKLKEAINKATLQYKNQINRSEAVFEQQVRDVIHGSKSNYDFINSQLFLFHIENLDEKQIGLIKVNLKEKINQLFDNQFENALIKISDKDLLLIIKHKKNESSYLYINEISKVLKDDCQLYFWIFKSTINKKETSLINSVNQLKEYSDSWITKPCYSISKINKDFIELPREIINNFYSIKSTNSQIEKKNKLDVIIKHLEEYSKQDRDTANIIFKNLNILLSSNKINYEESNSNYSNLLQTSPSLSPQIADVVNYIDKHFNEDIGIKQISHLIGMSPNYLSAKFKNEMNMRFIDYLTNKRIEKACFLLKNSNLFIHNIANEVGFRDVKHFSKLFKKSKGCLPSEY